jgi:hypothetical protein
LSLAKTVTDESERIAGHAAGAVTSGARRGTDDID